jgi:hypothetical protein
LAYILRAFTPYIYADYVYSNRLIGLFSWVAGYLIAAPIFFLLKLWDGFYFDSAAGPS